jgi:HD-GYP domain-containing protein (c-di-GMP phosphodiesterase class II)
MSDSKTIPVPIQGDDPVSQALNEFYLQLGPDNKASHVSLRIHLIRPDHIPQVSFYVQRKTRMRIYRNASDPLTPFEIKSLLDAGKDRIFLAKNDAPAIRKYLETFLQVPTGGGDASAAPKITTESQVGLMRSAAVRIAEDLFTSPSPENIRKGMKAVSGFVNLLVRDPKSFYYLIQLSSHDHYTYQHSVGVSLNAIALAKKIRLDTEKDMMDLGIAGLLHDIGKTKVKPEIINKPGPLTKEEWEEMRNHSQWGYDIVKDNPEISLRSKLAMLHHHEDNLGTGYPKGLTEGQISQFAKIITIADIFNALTTDRTYSKAKTPFEAFRLIQSAMMNKVDKQLFTELVMIYGGKLI